jgi:predicted metal-dependent enzyme (double-stranded beta helix superfamily)
MTPLEQFIEDVRDLTAASHVPPDEELATTVSELLRELVVQPGAVPEQFTRRSKEHGGRGRWILHRAPTFTVSSIVWAPGEVAPPHTHETWGAIGLVTNGIEERRYERTGDDRVRPVDHQRHDRGAVSVLVPDDDIHSMHNLTSNDTVEIHVYGKDLTGLLRKRWSLEGDDMKDLVSSKYFNC